MSKAKSQSTLAFPSRKSAATARKPAAGKQQQRSASAKKSQSSAISAAVVNKQLVSTPQKAEDDDEVQLTSTRSSPRSEPIHRTNSHERTKHVRDSLLAGTWTDASDNEILLRKFDLDYTYGPCGGLSRKARWQRAQQMHLNPPQHVWDILSQIDDDDEEAEGGGGVEVDEGERRKKRKKYDIDSHSIFENLTARILEAEGRGPP